jgi:hypothetical protein
VISCLIPISSNLCLISIFVSFTGIYILYWSLEWNIHFLCFLLQILLTSGNLFDFFPLVCLQFIFCPFFSRVFWIRYSLIALKHLPISNIPLCAIISLSTPH